MIINFFCGIHMYLETVRVPLFKENNKPQTCAMICSYNFVILFILINIVLINNIN